MKQENEPGILEEPKDCEETITFPEGQIKYEEELVNPYTLVIHDGNTEGKAVDIVDTVSKGFYGESIGDNQLSTSSDGSGGVNTIAVSKPNTIKGKTFFRNKANYPYGGLILVIIVIVIFSFINKECMCWNGIK